MSKLKGASSLDVNGIPLVKKELLGLIQESTKSEMKTFRLSAQAIRSLESLTHRLSMDARIKISTTKVLELAIFNAENLSLEELLQV